MAFSSAGRKSATRTLSNAGTPPYGPVHFASSGFSGVSAPITGTAASTMAARKGPALNMRSPFAIEASCDDDSLISQVAGIRNERIHRFRRETLIVSVRSTGGEAAIELASHL